MASSLLRNSQQVNQPSVPKPQDTTGTGNTTNSQLGTGTGKVINSGIRSNSVVNKGKV